MRSFTGQFPIGVSVCSHCSTMSFLSAFLPSPPDPASSQPFAQIAILHVLYYVLAVLAILPATSILKLAILPAILWQAWRIAVNSSLGSAIANLTGPDGAAQIDGLKALLMVRFCH